MKGRMITTLVAMTFALLTTGVVRAHADEVTAANVAQKMASASSPADNEALASYFTAQASAAAANAKEHEAMAASAKGVSGGGGKTAAMIAPHCEALAAASKKEQAAYEALAKEYAAAAKRK